ncbi:MAG: ArsJ-associated glyceraldehyde-3-phosphate dehydrogenase, partial [Pseudomonadota bacterium]|nr:ArsJ-associated glyceraldehyde-3-phosphate dehydrogenase [Pseudomonadota bacterium]
MSLRIGINGFGRIGRLALRSLWSQVAAGEVTLVRINDPGGDAATFAHLLEFDSVHGQWAPGQGMAARQDAIVIDGHEVAFSTHKTIAESDWSSCDVVIECSGKMKSTDKLNAYLDQGVGRVVVSAPVKEEGVLNVVVGVNDHLFEPAKHRIVTAASCTTNCLAPVVKVILEHFGIRHGSMTTVHDITNTQTILDAPHKDLRRARACGMSLIPTTTGSAKAITAIFPELEGKLNGHAIRVPLANASLTDMVFELEREVTVDEVNQALKAAADGPLKGILGYEERPLVSIDYRTDPRSSIIDALSTMV